MGSDSALRRLPQRRRQIDSQDGRRIVDGIPWHDSREIAAALGKLAGIIPDRRESMNKFWVILGNLALCAICAGLGWEAYDQGAPEMAMVGGIFFFLGLGAIYDTIKGR